MEEKILRHFDLSSQYGVCDRVSKIYAIEVSNLRFSRALESLDLSAGVAPTS